MVFEEIEIDAECKVHFYLVHDQCREKYPGKFDDPHL
jgi:hypothetical protein